MFYSILLVFLSAFFCLSTTTMDSIKAKLKLEPPYRTVRRNINDSLTVKCFVENRTDTTITWVDPNGEPIPITNNRYIRKRVELISNPFESTYANLILDNLDESDTGSYVCKHPSQMSASFSLSIFDSISFDDTEKTQFAVLGTTYIIKCTPKNLRNSTNVMMLLPWKVNKRAVDYSRMVPLAEGLFINKVIKGDSENEYICSAMDIVTPSKSIQQIIKLIVLKENFTESLLHGAVGQNVKIPCKAKSKLANYTWYDASNKQIIPSSENQMCFIENPNENMNILQVAVNNDKSFGKYTCITEIGNRTFGHIFRLNQVENPTTEQIEGHCFPPTQTSTEKSNILLSDPEDTNIIEGSTTPASGSAITTSTNYLSGHFENEEHKPPVESITTTTKKSSTQTVSTVINLDGSTSIKTTIISEEIIIVTTAKDR